MLGVLHTWTRDLRFHPHVHYLVPAIGVTVTGAICRPRNAAFLVPVKALALLFRAKLRAALRQTDLYDQVAPDTWRQPWVVDCRTVGSGAAALIYLAPYIFRVALSNNRIVSLRDDRVTFRYRDGTTKQMRSCTLPALTFMSRFLQHVLPKGFVKVRYYGLFSRRQRQMLAQIQQRLLVATHNSEPLAPKARSESAQTAPMAVVCPVCGQPMQAAVLYPAGSRSPPALPQ